MKQRFSVSSAGSARRWCSAPWPSGFVIAGVGPVRRLRRLGRPGAASSLYTLGQWREIADVLPAAQRALRRDGRRQRAGRARHSGRGELPVGAAEQALGSDRQPAVQPVRTRRSSCCKGLDAPVKFLVFDKETDFERYRDRADRVPVPVEEASTSSTSTPTSSRSSAKQYRRAAPTARSSSSTRAARERSRPTPSRTSPTPDQGRSTRSRRRSTSSAATAKKDRRRQRARPATARIADALKARQLQVRQAGARADEHDPGGRDDADECGTADRSARERSAADSDYLAKGRASCWCCSTRRRPQDAGTDPRSRPAEASGASTRPTRWSSTSAAARTLRRWRSPRRPTRGTRSPSGSSW